MTLRLLVLFPTVLAALVLQPAWAGHLPNPQGPVVLTVTGDISVTNANGAAEFDVEMLAEIGRKSFTTTTIWTEGAQEFTGTPLALLLETLGVAEGTLQAVALNDYVATIPVDEISADAPLLVWEVDGAYLPVRKRGPIWIVYPYDKAPEYRTDLIYARSVWQLARLDVMREAEN